MIFWLLAPVLFFLIGFLCGYLTSRVLGTWITKLIVGVVLWLPIVVLLLLQRTEVLDPDTLFTVSALLPRVIKLPTIGFLVGYTFTTMIAVARREGAESRPDTAGTQEGAQRPWWRRMFGQ